jgi:hypothetical protein
VLLSTTPTIAGTPLHGPINDVAKVRGRMRAFKGWIVTVPGFFG